MFFGRFKYDDQRSQLLIDLVPLLGFGPYSLEYLLFIPSEGIANSLEKYVCSIPTYTECPEFKWQNFRSV